jgi:iduronate 2-sulfatase
MIIKINIYNKQTPFMINSNLALAFTGTVLMGFNINDLSARDPDHPNILMIVVDDLNDWVGVMNAHPNAKTPNIDRLAERGTLFTNAHAAAPISAPTRAAFLSGLRPSTTGIYSTINYPVLMKNPHIRRITLLPEYFSKHGYKTLSTGKIFHDGSPPEAFEVVGEARHNFGPKPEQRIAYTPPTGTHTSTDWGPYPDNEEKMNDWRYAMWTIDQLNQDHDRPFFLSVGFIRPHVPWHVPQKWFDMHPLENIMLPLNKKDQLDDLPETSIRFSELPAFPKLDWMQQESRWEKCVQAYLACCTSVDHYIGLVLDALENSQYADNTIIVFFSDHGYHLGTKGIFAKHTLWEESTRIPMIISRPSDTLANRTHKPVNHMDIYPTLLDLANLPVNPDNEGQSLVPLMDNPDSEGFYSSITTMGFGNHSIRTERWRFIQYEDGSRELYDHWTDPNEWYNLAPYDQYANVINELEKHLPSVNARWDANAPGNNWNQYLWDLFEKTRSDK